MGKSKIKIQKIEKDSNRRVTFNKRRIGLLKKAYEISVLCEVDIALILFAQNGEMTCFEGPRSSIEEVVMKFASTPENERTRSHVRKYTTVEDQLGDTMPKNIENEEIFQEVARELYESCPKAKTSSECDRLHQMESCHGSSLPRANMEIQGVQHLLNVYDLNIPICDLLFPNQDASFMESYVQRQLQRIAVCKQQLPLLASSLPESWIAAKNYNKCDASPLPQLESSLPESSSGATNYNRIGWSTKLEEFCNVETIDQIQPPVLSPLSESANELLPEGIQDDIIMHDQLEDFKSFQKTWE